MIGAVDGIETHSRCRSLRNLREVARYVPFAVLSFSIKR